MKNSNSNVAFIYGKYARNSLKFLNKTKLFDKI